MDEGFKANVQKVEEFAKKKYSDEFLKSLRKVDPKLYEMIQAFDEKTGIMELDSAQRGLDQALKKVESGIQVITDSYGTIREGKFDKDTGKLIDGKETSTDGWIREGKFDKDTGILIDGKETSGNGWVWEGKFDKDTGKLIKGKLANLGSDYSQEGTFDKYTGNLIQGKKTYSSGDIQEGKFDKGTGKLIEGKITSPDGEIQEGKFDKYTGKLLSGTTTPAPEAAEPAPVEAVEAAPAPVEVQPEVIIPAPAPEKAGHAEHGGSVPEKVVDNNDLSVHDKDFAVQLDAAHDRTVRIEQLVDHEKTPTLKSDRFKDKIFYYDESRGSYYSGDQRLVIHTGDKIAVAEDERSAEEKERARIRGEYSLTEAGDGSYNLGNRKNKDKWEFDAGSLKVFDSMKNVTRIESGFAGNKKYYKYDEEKKSFLDSEGKKLVFNQDSHAFHTLKVEGEAVKMKTATEYTEKRELNTADSIHIMNELMRWAVNLPDKNKRNFTAKIERNLHKKYDKDFGKDFTFVLNDVRTSAGEAKIVFTIEGNGKKQTFEFTGTALEEKRVKTHEVQDYPEFGPFSIVQSERNRDAMRKLFRGDFFNGIFEEIDQGKPLNSKEK